MGIPLSVVWGITSVGSKVFYPVFFDMSGRRCLVVGGGPVGERRAIGLLDAGALVVLVSPVATETLQNLSARGRLKWHRRIFATGDIQGHFMVFAATDDADVNGAVQVAARDAGALFCGADAESKGDFSVPAQVHRGDLQIAVSTGGASPAFAKWIRDELAAQMGEEHAILLAYLKQLRPRVMARFPGEPDRRRQVWRDLVNAEVVALARAGRWDKIEERVSACLSS